MSGEEPALPQLTSPVRVASDLARLTIEPDDPGAEPRPDPQTAEVAERAPERRNVTSDG